MKRLRAVGIICVALGVCGGTIAAVDAGATVTPQAKAPVVPHEKLEALLPALAGWTRGRVSAETDREESVSRVTVDYDRGPSTLSVELMDSSLNEYVLALIKEAIAGKNPELTPTKVAGFPAAEQWIGEARRGAVHILVAGRFMVVVTGSTVSGLAEIRAAATAIDLQKLAALK